MKKFVMLMLSISMLFVGCSRGAKKGAGSEGEINVVSREDGSGTRGAFIEIVGIEEKVNGKKVDRTVETAEISNSTGVVMTTVAGDKYSIGYVSLGSLNDSVKALNVDGAPATVEAIKNGSYKVARPFVVVTTKDVDPVAQDLLNYIYSAEAAAVIEKAGYIPPETKEYTTTGVAGDIIVGGSSSVTPLMEKLVEAYKAVNPAANVQVQQNDSTTGVNSAIEGVVNLGMASRDLSEEEISKGAISNVIATDGIAVIVNKENIISDITTDEIKGIYVGDITDWSEIGK